ncbi:MAG: hypothetical protein ACF787_10465, partial [Rhodopirellula sp. JB053]
THLSGDPPSVNVAVSEDRHPLQFVDSMSIAEHSVTGSSRMNRSGVTGDTTELQQPSINEPSTDRDDAWSTVCFPERSHGQPNYRI